MIGVLRKAGSHWFAAAPATRPAILRILIGSYAFWYLWARRTMFVRVADDTNPALYQPVGLARIHRKRLPASLVRVAMMATLTANIAFIMGWRHQVTGPIYSWLTLWLLSYRNSWSMVYHSDNVLVFHLLILGHGRSADALSIDAWRGRPAGRLQLTPFGSPAITYPADNWQYGWPLRLMNAVTVSTYLLAGVAKLKGPAGRDWTSGQQLRRQIAIDALRKEVMGKRAAPMATTLYRQDTLFRVLAIGSLVIEAAAPLMLVDRRLARFWAVNAWAMHWGILALMNITFRYQLSGLMYLSFFDVERLLDLTVRWANQRLEEGERHAMGARIGGTGR